jgi:hypothetical protein
MIFFFFFIIDLRIIILWHLCNELYSPSFKNFNLGYATTIKEKNKLKITREKWERRKYNTS